MLSLDHNLFEFAMQPALLKDKILSLKNLTYGLGSTVEGKDMKRKNKLLLL